MIKHAVSSLPRRPQIHPWLWILWIGSIQSIFLGLYRLTMIDLPYTATQYEAHVLPKVAFELRSIALLVLLVLASIGAFAARYRPSVWRCMTGVVATIAVLFLWVGVRIAEHSAWFHQRSFSSHAGTGSSDRATILWFIIGGACGLSITMVLTLLANRRGTHSNGLQGAGDRDRIP